MQCTCIDMDIDVFSDMIDEKITQANENFICCECKKQIKKRENFKSEILSFENKISEYKICLACINIRDVFVCGSWIYGLILDEIYDCLLSADGDISENKIASLIPEAREKICEIIENVWEKLDD